MENLYTLIKGIIILAYQYKITRFNFIEMFSFNKAGLLVPDSKIITSKELFELEFVSNIQSLKRKELFDSLVSYNNELKKSCNLEVLNQWIDGSFVTKKINPGDIDVVTFLDFQIIEEHEKKLNDFKYPSSENLFGIDGYIVAVYPEDHENYFLSLSDSAYWHDKFTKSRRVRGIRQTKGFLEIKM